MSLLSGGVEKRLQADAQAATSLVVMPQRQLIEEEGAEQEALGRQQAAGGYVAQAAEDGFELGVEVLDAVGAQLMEDAADLDAIVRVRVGSAFGGDQEATGVSALGVQGRVVIVDITQHDVRVGREDGEQRWRLHVVGDVRRGGGSGQGQPDRVGDGDHHMQLIG